MGGIGICGYRGGGLGYSSALGARAEYGLQGDGHATYDVAQPRTS